MNTSLKTILWRTSVTAAIIILIASCFYSEENARGYKVWHQAEQDLAAKGESLNWNDYIPSAVPDDQNFFTAPMMTEWFVRSTNHGTSSSLSRLLANPETYTNFITEFSASNYLAWCATLEPEFGQIRDALKRPAAQINGDYSKPFFEPFANFVDYRWMAQVLAHEAKCHLLLGQTDLALADLTFLHNLDQTLTKSGRSASLVTAMIHSAIAGLYAQVIVSGLDSHTWHAQELAVLQRQLGEIHLLPIVAESMRKERAGACHLLDVSSLDTLMNRSGVPSQSVSDLGWWFVPSGWIDQNKALIANLESEMMDSINLTNQTVSPYKSKATALHLANAFRRLTPFNFIAAVCIPNFSKAVETTARNQTWVDQTLVVCALERYHLANGKYPVSLTDLVPQYLDKVPNDIITGTPMKYLRKSDQDFILYSVGWNETDEGGITVSDRYGSEDRESGDWVWHYSAQ